MTASAARQAALALAQALLPAVEDLPGVATLADLQALYESLEPLLPQAGRWLDRLAALLSVAALAESGSPFGSGSMSRARREQLVTHWARSTTPSSALFAAFSTALKVAYGSSEALHRLHRVPLSRAPAVPDPLPRFMQKVITGSALAETTDHLTAEVVVVGAGAAGAIVAKELAQRGHAVLIVEAGAYFRRDAFSGAFVHAASQFFSWGTENMVLGNVLLPVPTGRTVGGSTTVNTATCFRPPEVVYRRWAARGLGALSQAKLAPYFDEVEAALSVQPTPRRLWGRQIELLIPAFERRGLRHGPMARNAPDCDGQGTCDFGCPSGGKLSQDRAYIPWALGHGATLLAQTRLERLQIRHGQLCGLRLRAQNGRAIHVSAPNVVLSTGAFATPQILWEHELGGAAVGQHLTLHPSLSVSAEFSEPVRGFDGTVPSPYFVDLLRDRRMLLIAANLGLDIGAVPLLLAGQSLSRAFARYDHFGSFGVMVSDTNHGRLRRLPGGRVLSHYSLHRSDTERLRDGLILLCELYFDAGARVCYPAIRGVPPLTIQADLGLLRGATIDPADLVLTAYHPLGTCCMGKDTRTSVVGPDHRVRGVAGLFIVDGSVVPGPLGVNPQLTIMALARRAVDVIEPALQH